MNTTLFKKPVLVDVMRFGQPGSKPRPVKVVCESSATVRSILKGSPGLKSSKDFRGGANPISADYSLEF